MEVDLPRDAAPQSVEHVDDAEPPSPIGRQLVDRDGECDVRIEAGGRQAISEVEGCDDVARRQSAAVERVRRNRISLVRPPVGRHVVIDHVSDR